MIWHTNSWDNGKYTLRYKAYRLVGTTLESKILLPNTYDHFTLIVDNSQPEVVINRVKYDNGLVIPKCDIINLNNSTENLKFDITAWHENGYLDYYILSVHYGKNQNGQNGGYVVYDYYNTLHDSPPPTWQGYEDIEVEAFPPTPPVIVPPPDVDPWMTCAYRFRLYVRLRTTDGKQYIYDKEFNDHYYIDIGGDPALVVGDVNCDGSIDIVDALLIAQYFVGLIPFLPCF
jgi:hypothetical protein